MEIRRIENIVDVLTAYVGSMHGPHAGRVSSSHHPPSSGNTLAMKRTYRTDTLTDTTVTFHIHSLVRTPQLCCGSKRQGSGSRVKTYYIGEICTYVKYR